MPFVILPTNSASGGYDITNSLRFNAGSSDYLNRTLSASNRKTWTYSTWFKKSSNASGINLFSSYTDGNNRSQLLFTNADVFWFFLLQGGAFSAQVKTTQVFRDPSAWYHLILAVDSTQATASNRIKIYLNGSEITALSTSDYMPQNNDGIINNNQVHYIGAPAPAVDEYFNGYMAETYFIDGQQLTPSSFGETDSDTGIWKPKAYTGTYGTNGFYLQFKNSASLGTDSSGNGNNFTVNNLTSIDQTTDTPTNNFATLNPLNNLSYSGSGTLTEGNLQLSYSGGLFHTNATMAVNTGKWFWETKGVSNMQQGTIGARIGFVNQDNTGYASQFFDGGCIFGMFWHPTVGIYTAVGATQTLRSSTLTYTDGDIIGIALDLTNNISYWYKNGTLTFTYDFSALATIGSYFICPALGNGSGSASPVYQTNFGNPPYSANSYTDSAGFGNFSYQPPANYFSLCTKNLATYG